MPVRRIAVFLPMVIATGSLLAGCGAHENFEPGLKPGAEGITAVIQVYADAIAHGDGPRACSLMSKAAQQALIQRSGVTGNCLTAVTGISDQLSEDAATALTDLDVSDITGEETTHAAATATISGPAAHEAAAALGGTAFTMSVDSARWGITAIQPTA